MTNEFVTRVTTSVAWMPLALALIVGPLAVWWLVEPAPLALVYVSTKFVDRPVESREEAQKRAVTAVAGGTMVYRYVEFCVRKAFSGTARRAWVNTAMVWPAPDVPTALSREIGCRHTNIAVEVPTSNPTRTFVFVQTMEIEVNPLRTAIIEYSPIQLTILAPAK